MAALHTEAEMDPAAAGLEALHAAVAAGGDSMDVVQMGTFFGHALQLSQSTVQCSGV